METRIDYEQKNKEEFGQRLKYIRNLSKLSQKDFAFVLGMKQTEIGLYEIGKRFPRDNVIKNITDTMCTDFFWLKYGEYSPYTINKTPYGRDFTINHLDLKHDIRYEDVKDDPELVDVIKDIIEELSEDNKKLVWEVANALYQDQHNGNYIDYGDIYLYFKGGGLLEKYFVYADETKLESIANTLKSISLLNKYFPEYINKLKKENKYNEGNYIEKYPNDSSYKELHKKIIHICNEENIDTNMIDEKTLYQFIVNINVR
ncbi:MAG: helix-turn-helix domain-containing protein [Erysipelotrichaceae bacterium]|nr:helix-turn-helix domain-containing protein [Erysipelotrichaceae bacterium]